MAWAGCLRGRVDSCQLNAWYDQKGAENSDKCARTFSGTVTIGTHSWKIQGNGAGQERLRQRGLHPDAS